MAVGDALMVSWRGSPRCGQWPGEWCCTDFRGELSLQVAHALDDLSAAHAHDIDGADPILATCFAENAATV